MVSPCELQFAIDDFQLTPIQADQ